MASIQRDFLIDGEWIPSSRRTFEYDGSGRLSGGAQSFLNPEGAWIPALSYHYTYEDDLLVEERRRFERSMGANPDAGGRISYQYDDEGRIQRVSAFSVTSTPGLEKGSGYVSYRYDDDGRVARRIEHSGSVTETEYRYDDQDRIVEEHISFEYAARRVVGYTFEAGLLVERTESFESGRPISRIGRTYDADGLMLTETSSSATTRPDTGTTWRTGSVTRVTRDPESRSVVLETMDSSDDPALRITVVLAEDGTDNEFDVPWRPRISEWERTQVYPPR